MGIRQYIGARYVPIFFDNQGSSDWVGNHEYEPLTIVTYLGNSYTSKKFVPSSIGDPAHNSEYWASTGIYNSQVEEYRQEVLSYIERTESLEDDVEALDTRESNDVAALDSEIDGLKDRTESVEDDVEALETRAGNIEDDLAALDTRESNDVIALNAKITALKNQHNKKFIFIGDSYNSSSHFSWGETLITWLGLTAGTNVWNIASPGAGFGTESVNGGFYGALQDIAATISAENKLLITDIVIAGGANDWQASYANIVEGIRHCEDYIKLNFPNARFDIVACGWSYENNSIRSGLYTAYATYQEAVRFAKLFNRAYVQLTCPTYLTTDMVHPTALGGLAIAKMVVAALNGGNLSYKEYTDLSTGFTSVFNTSALNILGSINENFVHVYKQNATGIDTGSNDNPATVPGPSGAGTNGLLIARHSGVTGNYFFQRFFQCNCEVMYRRTGGRFVRGRAILTIAKQANEAVWDMYINSNEIVSGESDYPVTGVTGVYITFDVVKGPYET